MRSVLGGGDAPEQRRPLSFERVLLGNQRIAPAEQGEGEREGDGGMTATAMLMAGSAARPRVGRPGMIGGTPSEGLGRSRRLRLDGRPCTCLRGANLFLVALHVSAEQLVLLEQRVVVGLQRGMILTERAERHLLRLELVVDLPMRREQSLVVLRGDERKGRVSVWRCCDEKSQGRRRDEGVVAVRAWCGRVGAV